MRLIFAGSPGGGRSRTRNSSSSPNAGATNATSARRSSRSGSSVQPKSARPPNAQRPAASGSDQAASNTRKRQARRGGKLSAKRTLRQLPRIRSPGRRRRLDAAGEIELDAEMAVRAAQLVGEHPPRLDLHRPDVRRRGRDALPDEQLAREKIRRELLAKGGAGRDGVAAILAAHVLAPVAVAMVVLEAKAVGGSADHPSARAVLADMEGDPDLVVGASADVHDEPAGGELAVGGVVGDDTPFKCAAAERPQRLEEKDLRILAVAGGGTRREDR